jgi:hypothetical protein
MTENCHFCNRIVIGNDLRPCYGCSRNTSATDYNIGHSVNGGRYRFTSDTSGWWPGGLHHSTTPYMHIEIFLAVKYDAMHLTLWSARIWTSTGGSSQLTLMPADRISLLLCRV